LKHSLLEQRNSQQRNEALPCHQNHNAHQVLKGEASSCNSLIGFKWQAGYQK